MSNKKFKILFMFIFIVTLIVPMHVAFADVPRVGAFPTIEPDVQVKPGQTVTKTFKVFNSAIITADKDPKLFAYNISLEMFDMKTDSYKDLPLESKLLVDSSLWGKINTTGFLLNPEESKEFSVTFTIPENVAKGEYICKVRVTGKEANPSNTASFRINFTPSLDIDIILHVTDGSTDGLKSDYSVTDFSMGDNYPVKPVKELIKGLVGLKGNLSENWREIMYKPLKISWGSKTFYDIPSVSTVPLSKVYTTDKSKLSTSKYIYVPEGLKKKSVKHIDFKGQFMECTTSDGQKYIVDLANENVAVDVQEQMLVLGKLSKDQLKMLNAKEGITDSDSISWPVLEDKIQMKKYLDLANIKLLANCTIKNTGTRTIIPKGNLVILNLKNKEVVEKSYASAAILPDDTKNIIAILEYTNNVFKPGTYEIQSTIVPYEIQGGSTSNDKVDTRTIEVKNVRKWIIIAIIVIPLLLISVLIFGTVKLIKYIIKLRGKTNEKKVFYQ